MSNPNFDAILTTTLNNYRPELVDNIFTAQPLTYWLKTKEQIKLRGGTKIIVPLMYGTNTTAGSFSGYDTLAVTAQTGISAAEYSWKQFFATIAINGLEEAQNNGEQEVIDLLQAKTMQAEMGINEAMDRMFMGDGSLNSAKDWLGLMRLINDNNAVATDGCAAGSDTVGGIDSAANSYWRSAVDRNSGTDKVLLLSDMANRFNTAARGNDTPDLILSGQTLFEKHEAILQPSLRFADSTTADAGFQNLLFKGAVHMFDVLMVTGAGSLANLHKRMFFINSKYLTLYGHQDKWFVPTPFVKPNNQDARYAQILAYGELTVSARNRHARLDNRIP